MIEIIPLSENEMFEHVKKNVVDRAVFICDYFELWLHEDYLRFKSETSVEKNGKKHTLPSKEGNYIFSSLVGCKPEKYEEFDDRIEITMDNDVKIVCDTTLEPPCDNFHMKTEGVSLPVMI
jgi:hypothetical protein